MNSKCIYFVEGECEKQLINALKISPEILTPGKVKVYNVKQNLIPKSQLEDSILVEAGQDGYPKEGLQDAA